MLAEFQLVWSDNPLSIHHKTETWLKDSQEAAVRFFSVLLPCSYNVAKVSTDLNQTSHSAKMAPGGVKVHFYICRSDLLSVCSWHVCALVFTWKGALETCSLGLIWVCNLGKRSEQHVCQPVNGRVFGISRHSELPGITEHLVAPSKSWAQNKESHRHLEVSCRSLESTEPRPVWAQTNPQDASRCHKTIMLHLLLKRVDDCQRKLDRSIDVTTHQERKI